MNISFLKSHKFWCIVHVILIVLWCLYIFSNSLQSAEESSEESQGVVEVIEKAIQKVEPDFELSHHFVRKTAHFVEYFVLGSLLSLVLFYNSAAPSALVLKTTFAGLFTALCDETLQLFSQGRDGAVLDVWLDFSAVIFSHFIALLIYYFIKSKKSL